MAEDNDTEMFMNQPVPQQPTLAWRFSSMSTASSPMTDLALNLEEITRFNDTAKRRISWSSNESASPCRPHLLSLKDDASFNSSSSLFDSPMLEERVLRDMGSAQNIGIPTRSRILSRISSASTSGSEVFCSGKENSPRSSVSLTSPIKCLNKDLMRPVFEESDVNYGDGGFCEKQEGSHNFRFTQPVGVAPRRVRALSATQTNCSQLPLSPVSMITIDSTAQDTKVLGSDYKATASHSILVKSNSEDDGFLEELDCDIENDEHSNSWNSVPPGIQTLLTGSLQAPSALLNSFGNSNSSTLVHNQFCTMDIDSPKGKSCVRGLFGARKRDRCPNFDRWRPTDSQDTPSPLKLKRRKSMCINPSRENFQSENSESMELTKRPMLQRCFSESAATIMTAVQRSVSDPTLIGDCSKPYLLPLINGRHEDLKSISHETVASILNGHFSNDVDTFLIVDCRYPYEYEGGHIKGALNIYSKDGIIKEFIANPRKAKDIQKRIIIAFHCEFSSERGPTLSRFLRNKDRESNKDHYPQLYYPEIYILEGGYKLFFEHHRLLCEPPDYKPMLHKDHENDLRHFRAKSKSWNGERGMGRLASCSGI